MSKVWVLGADGVREFPESTREAVLADVALHNRDRPPDQRLLVHIGPEPPRDRVYDKGELREMSAGERAAASLIELDPTRKVEEDEVVPKTAEELVADGVISREDVRERVLRRLRSEVAAYFESHRTPNGYRVDALARQKAAFGYPFRILPGTDPTKQRLLEDGLIYPDHVQDEILGVVREAGQAYRAAKDALNRAFGEDAAISALEQMSTGLR